jgi:hypothetical protein
VGRYQLSVTPQQFAVRPERQHTVVHGAAVLLALVDTDDQHRASAARGRCEAITRGPRDRDALAHQRRVPLSVIANRQRIDPNRRTWYKRFGKYNQLGALFRRPVRQLVDSVQRRRPIQQHRTVLNCRHAHTRHAPTV